jgi:hypothetical protein
MIAVRRNLPDLFRRNAAFIAGEESDRPLVGIHVWERQYRRMYRETNRTIPENGPVRPQDIHTDLFLTDIERLLAMNERIGGDLFWPVVSYVYIPWMEAIIGCPVHAIENSFYANPCVESWGDFDADLDAAESPWLAKLLELHRALLREFGDDYPIASSSHLRGPVDMMAAALGQTRLPLEFYDNPDRVRTMCAAYSRVFGEVATLQNQLSAEARFGGFTVNGYGVWTPRPCQYLQDDGMAFLSPDIYRRFIVGDHRGIARSFDSIFYHVHPVSLFIVDELLTFENLRILEINREPEAIGPSVRELLPVFRRTQESGKALLVNFTQGAVGIERFEEEVALLCDELPYRGLCLYVMADDEDDGMRRMDIIRAVLRRRGAAVP